MKMDRDRSRDDRVRRNDRNRSRSPVDRRDHYRRRSPSYNNIDRYVPGPQSIPVNQLRDPMLEDSQVGFSYFAEWWKTEQEIKAARQKSNKPKESREEQRPRIQAAYDDYKVMYNAKMAKQFVDVHKEDDWFRERYDPTVSQPLKVKTAEFRKTLYEYWEAEVDAGSFDDYTMEGVNKDNTEDGLAVSDLVPLSSKDLRDPILTLPTLLIKTITPSISRNDIERFCQDKLGSIKWLSLSDPNPGKKFHRLGWIILDKAEEPKINDSLLLIDGKSIKEKDGSDFTIHVGIHKFTEMSRKKALWDLFSAPERIEQDLAFAVRIVNKLDQEANLPGALVKVEHRVDDLVGRGHLQSAMTNENDAMEEGEENDNVDDEETVIKKKKLDLLVEYLRRVHSFCFYCVFQCDSVHELQRKCAGGHLRRPRTSLTSSARDVAKRSVSGGEFDDPNRTQLQKAFNWVKTYEEKVLQVLEPENADLKKLGGRPISQGFDEELSKWVKKEDESKYRCKLPECTKLFKGYDFWKKHVEKRHPEWIEKVQDELALINRYVLDPSRLAIGRNDAGSNGHFPLPNNVPNGTPRNFTLSSAHHGSSWPPSGMSGPMRNGNRSQPRNAQQSRSNNNNNNGRNRQETIPVATQVNDGRTMKSYTDLDAPSVKSTALDY